MSSQKSQTYVFGAIILMISNVLVKIIGMFFRIPLTNTIGVEGMAYYNAAYSIYVSFYMISTAGIPVAISRMIAASNSQNNIREVKKIFSLAYKVFFVIGVAGTAIMIGFSKQFAAASGMPDAYLAMIAIAPTLFFICLSSAYRGYFQGLQNMVPSAVSQVIEAVGKIGIGLFAAWYFYSVKGCELPVVAAYVILGVTIGVAAAAVYIAVAKRMFTSSAMWKQTVEGCADMQVRSTKSLLYELIITSLPIALASSIMGLTNTVDTMLLARRLAESGITRSAATSFYGTYSSMVIPLFNMAPPLIYPFAISAIPALSAAIARNKRSECESNMMSAFRMGALIAIPCSIGMASMSRGIISVLYNNQKIDVSFSAFRTMMNTSAQIYPQADFSSVGYVNSLDLAAPALSVVASAIFFLAVISITNSILQAYRFEKQTIVSTTLGILVKIGATYALSSISGIGIMGSAIGTAAGYFTIMSCNIFFVVTKTKFVPSFTKIFLKPLIAGVCCGAAAFAVNALLVGRLGLKLSAVVSIIIAAAVYVAVIVAIKGINRYDIMMLPKGDKICAVLDKFSLLEKE